MLIAARGIEVAEDVLTRAGDGADAAPAVVENASGLAWGVPKGPLVSPESSADNKVGPPVTAASSIAILLPFHPPRPPPSHPASTPPASTASTRSVG